MSVKTNTSLSTTFKFLPHCITSISHHSRLSFLSSENTPNPSGTEFVGGRIRRQPLSSMKIASNMASHDELDRNSQYPAAGRNDKSYILNLVHFEVDVGCQRWILSIGRCQEHWTENGYESLTCLKMSSFTLSFMCRVATGQKIIYAHGHVCEKIISPSDSSVPSPLRRCTTWPSLSLDSAVLLLYTASPDETLRTSPGTARKVPSLSRYALDFKFPALSSSFYLSLRLHSTSLATNLISGIPQTIRFIWSPCRASKCASCFVIHHVLLLLHFDLLSCCIVP